MAAKTILFDLDGTLLPMDQDAFVHTYFRELAAQMVPLGFEKQLFIKAMWAGIQAMMKNDGFRLNEKAFWDTFSAACGKDITAHMDTFEQFYRNDFEKARVHCNCNPAVPQLIHELKAAGHRVVLATSPVYPQIATNARIRWAGLEPSDFELVTTYENCGFCKPNPAYYSDLAQRLQVKAADCVMVGNDVEDDLPSATVGMQVFLLTDHLINKTGKDISPYPHGDFAALREFLKNML